MAKTRPARKPVIALVEDEPQANVPAPPDKPPRPTDGDPLSPEILDALNSKADRGATYSLRMARHRQIVCALLPVVVVPGPLTSPETVASIREALEMADLVQVLEEQHENETGLPEVPRARR